MTKVRKITVSLGSIALNWRIILLVWWIAGRGENMQLDMHYHGTYAMARAAGPAAAGNLAAGKFNGIGRSIR